jgi:hypothetical protein
MDGKLGQLERERAIAHIARAQHGVISAVQLAALGISRHSIRARLARGRLHLVHRGVYAVGHPLLSERGTWMAAVLACGPDTVLSHRSAAALWGLRSAPAGDISVTSPRRASSRPGIRVHRVRELPGSEVSDVDAIPVTSVARTLLDLAGVVAPHALERACDQAEILRLFDLTSLHAVLAHHPKRRGARALRRVLAEHTIGLAPTQSELESRLLTLCADHGLPMPECNVPVALPGAQKTTVDFLWRVERLVVETDGWETHRTRLAFERDRDRDARLALGGYRCIRFTWRRLRDEPREVARTLRALLNHG